MAGSHTVQISVRALVIAQQLQTACPLPEQGEGLLECGDIRDVKLGEEEELPGPACNRAALKLLHVESVLSEDLKRVEKTSCPVCDRERNGSAVRLVG